METQRQQLISQIRHALYQIEQPHGEVEDLIEFTIGDIEFKFDNTIIDTPIYDGCPSYIKG